MAISSFPKHVSTRISDLRWFPKRLNTRCCRRGSRGGEMGEFSPPFFWAPSFFFFLSFKYWPQTPQPGFGSIILLQIFTPHFKILDPRLCWWCSQTFSYSYSGQLPKAMSIFFSFYFFIRWLQLHPDYSSSQKALGNRLIIIKYFFHLFFIIVFRLLAFVCITWKMTLHV